MRIDVNNISHATLTRIAPKVEQLVGRDIPSGAPNVPITREMGIFAEIRAEIAPYRTPIEVNKAQFMAARTASRLQRMANGQMNITAGPGEHVGGGAFVLHDDGTFTLKSVEELRESNRQWQQDLVGRLMEAINAMRATSPQPPTIGGGIDIQA